MVIGTAAQWKNFKKYTLKIKFFFKIMNTNGQDLRNCESEVQSQPELAQHEVKELRAAIQRLVDEIKKHCGSRELSLVITKLEEAKMWAGKHLGNFVGNSDLNAE